MKKSYFFAIALIILAAVFRIASVENSLWLNMSILGGISLFSGAIFKNKSLAFIIPLVSYLLTDIYIHFFTDIQGFYGISQVFTYMSLLLVVLLGAQMKSFKALNVLGYSVSGALVFWIVSNFGVWFSNLFTGFEPGLTLAATYIRAIPFYNQFASELFLGTFVGDIVSSCVLFGAYALAKKSVFSQATVAVK